MKKTVSMKTKIKVRKHNDPHNEAIHNTVRIFDEVYDEEMKCRIKNMGYG